MTGRGPTGISGAFGGMSRGCSRKTFPGQVSNRLSKHHFQHKHNTLSLDPESLADRLTVLPSLAQGQPPVGLLRGVQSGLSMVNGLARTKGLEMVLQQATFGQLNQANNLVQAFLMSPDGATWFITSAMWTNCVSGEGISTITGNIKQRRCNYRRSVRQTINRRNQQDHWKYFLKKF